MVKSKEVNRLKYKAMKKTNDTKPQTFGLKLAIMSTSAIIMLAGIIFSCIEIDGGGIWLHTIGMCLLGIGILLFDTIEQKKKFIFDVINRWKSVLSIIDHSIK